MLSGQGRVSGRSTKWGKGSVCRVSEVLFPREEKAVKVPLPRTITTKTPSWISGYVPAARGGARFKRQDGQLGSFSLLFSSVLSTTRQATLASFTVPLLCSFPFLPRLSVHLTPSAHIYIHVYTHTQSHKNIHKYIVIEYECVNIFISKYNMCVRICICVCKHVYICMHMCRCK